MVSVIFFTLHFYLFCFKCSLFLSNLNNNYLHLNVIKLLFDYFPYTSSAVIVLIVNEKYITKTITTNLHIT